MDNKQISSKNKKIMERKIKKYEIYQNLIDSTTKSIKTMEDQIQLFALDWELEELNSMNEQLTGLSDELIRLTFELNSI